MRISEYSEDDSGKAGWEAVSEVCKPLCLGKGGFCVLNAIATIPFLPPNCGSHGIESQVQPF